MMSKLFFILWFICLTASAEGSLPYREINLVGRGKIQLSEPTLSNADWQWLRRKRVLIFGLAAPNYPPFDITSGMRDYGGINADYLGIIGYNLNVQIKVRYYEDNAALRQDLAEGKVDLIGNVAIKRGVASGLLLSTPYVPVTPALVARTDGLLRQHQPKNIAVERLYRDNPSLIKQYPGAHFQTFDVPRRALEALSFKNLDEFIGDATVARYLINQGNLNNLRLQMLPLSGIHGFSFGVTDGNVRLQRIVNSVLGMIPESTHAAIQSRWNGGIQMSQGEKHLLLTSLERKWVEEHRKVRLVVNGDFAPLGFFDFQGTFRGLTADILDAISNRTGLEFDIIRAKSLQDSLNVIKAGKADVVAGVTVDAAWPNGLQTTRSYLFNSWVLVGLPSQDEEEQPRKIALVDGHPLREFLSAQYPGSHIVPVASPQAGIDAVRKGKAQALVLPMISADYFLAHEPPDGLRILSSLNTEPARFVIGISGNEYPLATIIDKALLNIPPEDIHAMTSTWYNNTYLLEGAQSDNKIKYRYYPWLLLGLVMGLVLMATSLIISRIRHKRFLQQRCQFIIDSVPLPIYLADWKDRIIMGNIKFFEAVNAPAAEVVGALLDDYQLKTPASLNLELGDEEQGETLFVTRHINIGAEPRTLQQWSRLLMRENQRVEGKLGGWLDVTERDRLIAQLRQAKEHADGANRAKTTFLATMSHEIRTPLNAIIGMLELVLSRKQSDKDQDMALIGIAHESAHSLLALIGDILDISRIESDRLILHPERADIRRLIESVAMLFEGVARQKDLAFKLDIDAEISGDVFIDPVRFKQVLSNLLSNAIKFTAHGQVSICAAVEQISEDRIDLRLRVSDTGKGIDTAMQARLFQPFTQGGGESGGAGLGLYICHKLIEMMGGTISLSSEVGIGSEATVTLSVARLLKFSPQSVRASGSVSPSVSLQILVVEDHAAGRMLLTQQLLFLGHQPVAAADGEQALALFEQQRFDLVITDCQMPKLDGYSLSRRIRQGECERQLKPVTIWGLTANAQETARAACLQAGMDDCLFKPINLEILKRQLIALPATSVGDRQETSFSGLDRLPAELRQPEVLEEFISTMLQCLQEDCAQLRLELDTQPLAAENLMALGHKLAGAARLVNAEEMSKACQLLQEQPGLGTAEAVLSQAQLLSVELRKSLRTTNE
ncbi:ATP-binding protein [Serratia sp. NPDC078593]|uniref:ATP-binding protein n=1 Tax=unclassified Serratia (in: enterobacteria) TaxID=2647522 RepID=UPI0037CCD749